VAALKLKSELFRQALDEDAASLEASTFKQLCAFMPTVRRRIAPWLEEPSFNEVRGALVELLGARTDTSATDARIAAFCSGFADPKEHRWVRDLAALGRTFSPLPALIDSLRGSDGGPPLGRAAALADSDAARGTRRNFERALALQRAQVLLGGVHGTKSHALGDFGPCRRET